MSQRISVGELQSLIDFRSQLITFNRTLADDFSAMRSHWQSLGDVWTDAKYDEFGQALNEVNVGIDRYLAATDDHEVHLAKLIEILTRYIET